MNSDREFGGSRLTDGGAVDDAEGVFVNDFVELEVDVGVAVPFDALGGGLLFGFTVAGVGCGDHGETLRCFFSTLLCLLVYLFLFGL